LLLVKICVSHLEKLMAGKSPKSMSFEASLAELEKVVAEMESGKLPLEESLAAYQRGMELLRLCRGRLEDAQQQVRVLEDGNLKDFTASTDRGNSDNNDAGNIS
jgi:exodeoxyribonuclease VII small subunit